MRAGLMKFEFSRSDNAHILVDTQKAVGYAKIIPDSNEIVGYSDIGMFKVPTSEFKGYFVIKFDKPFSSWGTWEWGDNMHPGDSEITAYNSGAWVTFSVNEGETIMVKASISFISIDQARANLDSEIPDWGFDQVRSGAENAWEEALGKIEVEGGSENQKKIFYTALYHSLLLPRVSYEVTSEGNKYYSVFDASVHTGKFYNDFSMWDSFRSQNALLILLYPDRVADMCQSLVDMYKQGGWIPKWPNPGYSGVMIGTHSDSIIAESYLKGITDFDIENAYKGIMKHVMENGTDVYEARAQTGRWYYENLGYVPAGITFTSQGNEGTSWTLELAYDDWCIAQLAKALGKDNDYDNFMNRATYYRNVFDNSVGFVRGKYANGAWAETSFDPTEFLYSWMCQPKEGNPWQYTWFVPHDVLGLKQLIDGSKNNPNYPGDFTTKLETLFQNSVEPSLLETNDYTEGGRVRYYWHGNEPCQHISYLFNYAGQPWRTQFWVDYVMKTRYRACVNGLPGNDDCGQTSSWYVLSAMGFYPVTPPSCTYVIGRPIFDNVTIHLGNGNDFVIEAQNVSDENMYIQSATLNGENLNKSWFEHENLANGGTLIFVMGSTPNENWGIDPPPPSMSDLAVENLVIWPEIVGAGEDVTISVDVKNRGIVEGSKLVELEISGEIVDDENVSVAPSSENHVSFIVSRDVPGVYPVRIDDLSGSFEVVFGQAEFVVENLNISPEAVEPGENVTISVDVGNVGEAGGTHTVELMIDGELENSATVLLNPGESQHISFIVTRDTEGTYSVEVDGLTGSFEVRAPSGGVSIFALSAAAIIFTVAAIGGVMFYRRR